MANPSQPESERAAAFSFRKLAVLLLGLHLLLGSFLLSGATPGNVYLVLGSDTAIWNVPGGLDVAKYRQHFSLELYTQPQSNAFKVMDPAFRAQFTDSIGQPLRMTWWMLVGSAYGQADNTDVPIPNLMPLSVMRKYHGDALRLRGDELTLHYHTFFWSDFNGDGVSYWNQAQSFHDCRADWDQALAQSLLEEEVFPVSFRSGWHYMDNEWQGYLNQLLPYSMDDDWPNVRAWYTAEPIFNVLDWSQAPSVFVPFHPASTNYQAPGDGTGWNVRSVRAVNTTQALLNQAFAAAAAGTDQVVSIWAHLPEVDFLTNLARIDTMAHVAASNYPTAPFFYCTAVEAMQRWLGSTDRTPPQLDLAEQVDGENVTLRLQTSEPIFQAQPFLAVKDIYQQYAIVPCQSSGPNAWTALLPVPRSRLAKYGVAVTDVVGNLTTRIVRYLPDDLFLDNLDPVYAEVRGNWTNTTKAAWGTDARVAVLGSNETAQARWFLPITLTAPYHVFIQVPAVSKPAGQVRYDLIAGGSNVFSVVFPTAPPAAQWVYLGSAYLEATLTNSLVMTVSGEGQAGTVAVADVVKVSPLTPALPGFITDVQVDPGDTTANLTWTTATPALSLVQYGLSTAYGAFSATNTVPTRNQVVTLHGLKPGTTYSYRICATAGELTWFEPGLFTTTPIPTSTNLWFDVTSVWKYTTNNQDGRPGWKGAGYDDSNWPEGPGLLWVDTRPGGPNALVRPRNTQLPDDPVSNYPWRTYYFRKHFNVVDRTTVVMLMLSNYIDDGAVFYLNGVELRRNNLPAAPAVIGNTNLATAYNCGGDATCPVVFNVVGAALTNLVSGDNVLAVEVHNYSATSPDVTFGAALFVNLMVTLAPDLKFTRSEAGVTLYWNGAGFTVQAAATLERPASTWSDVPGPITASPYVVTNLTTRFFRLRH